MISLLRLIPGWSWLLIGLGIFGAGWYFSGLSHAREMAELKASYAEARRIAEKAEREKERTWNERVTEAATHAQNQINALEADLAASRTAADGLRVAAQRAARRACPKPAAASAGQGEPDSSSLDVLVDVLGRADQRAGELAEFADRLRIAGVACERAYDSLADVPAIPKSAPK